MVQRGGRMVVYTVNCVGYGCVESTESRVYSGIKSELCGLWTELNVQRTGRMVV